MTNIMRLWQGAFAMHLFYKYYALAVGNMEMFRLGTIVSILFGIFLVFILLSENRR